MTQPTPARDASPVVDGAVLQTVDRQVRRLVGLAGGHLLVELHADTGRFARVQVPVGEGEGVLEHLVGARGVAGALLDAEGVGSRGRGGSRPIATWCIRNRDRTAAPARGPE